MSHNHDHFFQGICICACRDCTAHPTQASIKCICPDCPAERCGLKKAKVTM